MSSSNPEARSSENRPLTVSSFPDMTKWEVVYQSATNCCGKPAAEIAAWKLPTMNATATLVAIIVADLCKYILFITSAYINKGITVLYLYHILKRIEIIIPHRKLEDAHEIVKDVNTGGMSYYTVEGSGRIKAERITVGRGTAQTQPQYIPRTKIEVVVKDHQVEDLISKITEKLGSELGGKIFVVDVPIAVDLGTKKTGEDAI